MRRRNNRWLVVASFQRPASRWPIVTFISSSFLWVPFPDSDLCALNKVDEMNSKWTWISPQFTITFFMMCLAFLAAFLAAFLGPPRPSSSDVLELSHSLGSLRNDDEDCNENGKKSNRFRQAKQELCTRITLFCTFLCRRCTTTTWTA